jgi:hypothetical protein
MKYHKWGCDQFYDSPLSKCGETCPAYVKGVDGCQHRKQVDCTLAMEPPTSIEIERVADDGIVFIGMQAYAFSEIKLLKVDYDDGRGYVTEVER